MNPIELNNYLSGIIYTTSRLQMLVSSDSAWTEEHRQDLKRIDSELDDLLSELEGRDDN